MVRIRHCLTVGLDLAEGQDLAVVDQLEVMVTTHLLQLRVARLLQALLQALLLKLLVRRAVEPPREKLRIQP